MIQQFRKSITALAFFLGVGSAVAQPTQPPLALRADAPDRYVVVRGDTLWGISERYIHTPWRWPELWGMNKEQIRNPHLIYPGMVLLFDRTTGRLSIAGTGDLDKVKLAPKVRSEPLGEQGIPSIPPDVIEPFLTRPLVIEPDGLENAPTIIATEQDKVILSAGNSAYVRSLGDTSEQTWYVYRPGKALVDPETNQTLGYEAIYLGTAKLTRPGEPATVVLTSAVQEVNAGDKLVAAGRVQPVTYAPHAPDVHIAGRIMTIYGGVGGVGEAGPLQVVSINRGRRDGVELGHVLAVYSLGGTVRDVTKGSRSNDALIKLPDEHAGVLFVFRVFDRVSYGLIMRITRPVRPLDVVRAP